MCNTMSGVCESDNNYTLWRKQVFFQIGIMNLLYSYLVGDNAKKFINSRALDFRVY